MIPVYIVTGLLESGKTTFIKETLMTQEWIDPGTTVLISCEEGETDCTKEYLENSEIVKLDLEDQEEFNATFLKSVDKNYQPIQVIIEYNGMWDFDEFLSVSFPGEWEIAGVYSTINGITLDSYLKNMRKLVMEQTAESELIVVNRCPEEFNRGSFKRAITVQNPMAQIIFERPDGTIIQPTEEDLPFDTKSDKVKLEDSEFGIWYVDAYDNPARYEGKEITYLAQAFRPKEMEDNMFVPGRLIMTCCADDVRFYGYPCQTNSKLSFNSGDWVKVTVRFEKDPDSPAGEGRPLMQLIKIKTGKEPKEKVVYLN
ncbi:MAG: GTP-binding protein [Suipraeoptans sp.]